MAVSKAARRRDNCERAKGVAKDTASIAETYERFTRYAAWIFGLTFGILFALAIVSG